MRVRIINTNSEHSKHRIGQYRDIEFDQYCMLMKHVEDSSLQARTSTIKKIIVQTNNTIYEMEVIDPEKSN